jgi:PAS domain S-box-containing protein
MTDQRRKPDEAIGERGNPQPTGRQCLPTVLAATESAAALARLEDELREREATLRGILNAARESIWLFAADGRVLLGNETALQRWGAPPESIIGKHVPEVLPGSLGQSRMAHVRQVVESAGPVTFEDERAGMAFEHRFYPVLGSDGQVERVACFSRDVTRRKQIEHERERLLAELQRRTAELDATIASMVDGLVIYGADGQRRFANPAAEAILQYTAAEQATSDLAARSRMMGFLTEDGLPFAPHETPVGKALRGEASKREVMRVPRTEGDIWISVSASPIHGPAGEIVGAVSTVRDITQSRQIQARVVWQASFPERNPLPITEVSLSGEIHYINPSARRWFPDLQDRGLEHPWLVDWSTATGELQASPGSVWERIVTVGERSFQQSLHLLPEVGRVRIYGRDITERLHVERALREANRRLQEADERKNEFLATLSHELRNPLAPIRNSLHTLTRVAPDSEAAQRARTIIERQTAHMTRLVDDLLDITRVSRGKIRLRRATLELGEVVCRSTEDVRPLFAEGGIELHLTIANAPTWVDGDVTRLEQTVGNLLHNALKFTPRGGHVWVSLTQEGPNAVLRVRDTGTGMGPDMQARLFEPFAQADNTLDRNQSGLGLGLALVKGLVTLHAGDVSAHSEGLGRGTELVVRLPVVPEPAVPKPDAGRDRLLSPRRRVLVIEDNRDAASSLCEALELGGHHVAVAHDGYAGLAKARTFRPEAVLCDIGLPGLDGYEVARAVRADEVLASVFLVALTGYALPEDSQRAQAAGFDCHIAKPPSLERLEALLAELR